MAKIFVQQFPTVWQTSASIAVSGSVASGSYACEGYARLVGILTANASSVAASGLRVYQSMDSGSNWDFYSDWVITACSGSAFSIEILGNTVKLEYRTDSAASQFRTLWMLRPV